MAGELEPESEREEMERHFEYMDSLSEELEELSVRYESVSNLYALALERLEVEGIEWKRAYINRAQARVVAEEDGGTAHGDSGD